MALTAPPKAPPRKTTDVARVPSATTSDGDDSDEGGVEEDEEEEEEAEEAEEAEDALRVQKRRKLRKSASPMRTTAPVTEVVRSTYRYIYSSFVSVCTALSSHVPCVVSRPVEPAAVVSTDPTIRALPLSAAVPNAPDSNATPPSGTAVTDVTPSSDAGALPIVSVAVAPGEDSPIRKRRKLKRLSDTNDSPSSSAGTNTSTSTDVVQVTAVPLSAADLLRQSAERRRR